MSSIFIVFVCSFSVIILIAFLFYRENELSSLRTSVTVSGWVPYQKVASYSHNTCTSVAKVCIVSHSASL